MPTSARGIAVRRGSSRRRAPVGGFTLLEMLVVVAIIGIFIGVVVLSTDLVGFDRRLEQEAKRLGTILDFVTDEAVLQTQDFGLLICDDGYHFFIYDYELDHWVPYRAKPFEAHMLDTEDMLLTLRLDDSEVLLQPTAVAFPRQWVPPYSENDLDAMPDPQIVVLSSGEITPFQIEFLRRSERVDPGIELNVAFDGKSEVVFGAY